SALLPTDSTPPSVLLITTPPPFPPSTLSLPDALPISARPDRRPAPRPRSAARHHPSGRRRRGHGAGVGLLFRPRPLGSTDLRARVAGPATPARRDRDPDHAGAVAGAPPAAVPASACPPASGRVRAAR